jgi:hypothetical protein
MNHRRPLPGMRFTLPAASSSNVHKRRHTELHLRLAARGCRRHRSRHFGAPPNQSRISSVDGRAPFVQNRATTCQDELLRFIVWRVYMQQSTWARLATPHHSLVAVTTSQTETSPPMGLACNAVELDSSHLCSDPLPALDSSRVVCARLHAQWASICSLDSKSAAESHADYECGPWRCIVFAKCIAARRGVSELHGEGSLECSAMCSAITVGPHADSYV